jgi:hypothetical protein
MRPWLRAGDLPAGGNDGLLVTNPVIGRSDPLPLRVIF